MTGPVHDLAGTAAAEERLLETVATMTDEEAATPSLLPGWSRAEVVTHLARNADAHTRMAEGAMRGEVVDQYAGGTEERAAGIAAGRGHPAADLAADLAGAVEALHETWAAMPDEAWGREVSMLSGRRAAGDAVAQRWIEVEVHHADLGLRYTPAHWPEAFVRRMLGPWVARLPGLATEPPDAAWVLWADDLTQAWVVRARRGRVESHAFTVDDDVQPDVLVRGPGWAVLAWALGRAGGREALTITGTDALAAAFPTTFRFG